MTSYEMDFLVRDRIRERMREADNARLGRLTDQARRDESPRPPRGPLVGSLSRLAARLAHVA